jgi:hypothetical protein
MCERSLYFKRFDIKKPLPERRGKHLIKLSDPLSSSRNTSAGIGTVIRPGYKSPLTCPGLKWLPRLHRAGPSASLDKSVISYSIAGQYYHILDDLSNAMQFYYRPIAPVEMRIKGS